MNSEQFLFDDFFVGADDPGVQDEVTINGRQVPIRWKRGLTLRDREEAKARALTTKIGSDGQLVVTGMDDGVFVVELLVRTIKSWPFTYPDGSPVPVTREMLQSMLAAGADALRDKALELARPKAAVLVPFEKPSDAA